MSVNDSVMTENSQARSAAQGHTEINTSKRYSKESSSDTSVNPEIPQSP